MEYLLGWHEAKAEAKKEREREIFWYIFWGKRNGNFGCTHREKEGEALDSTSSRPSRRCLCRLAFSIRSSLSFSSDLIPVLSDLGLGFRFVFLNSISFFVCFPGNFFQRFRLIDEDLNRGIFFFWGLWIGLVWKIWDCYVLLIIYGDAIRWSWNSVLFITTRVVVRFSLCHRNFYRIVKFWIVKFRYFVGFINYG